VERRRRKRSEGLKIKGPESLADLKWIFPSVKDEE
jgi:hypothetical protein